MHAALCAPPCPSMPEPCAILGRLRAAATSTAGAARRLADVLVRTPGAHREATSFERRTVREARLGWRWVQPTLTVAVEQEAPCLEWQPALHALSDDELLGNIGAGDSAALEALYDRHHRTAMALAYRLLGDRLLAEDVVQEAFFSVWRRAGTFQPGRGSGRGWLLALVRNRAIDRLRRS